MRSKQLYAFGAVIAVLIGGAVYVASTQNSSQDQQAVQDAQQTPGFSERFVAYSDEHLKKATENGGKAIVFFHASWCPLCSQAEADLKANWGKVPRDVTILKTDYDSSRELKTKYGVVSQDTWVQLDEKGEVQAKWNSGGRGLQTLLANLK